MIFFKDPIGGNSGKPIPVNISLGFVLLGALFYGAISINDDAVKSTLLNCFTILFTVLIGVLSFEGNKRG